MSGTSSARWTSKNFDFPPAQFVVGRKRDALDLWADHLMVAIAESEGATVHRLIVR
jgi:hypothetical protein